MEKIAECDKEIIATVCGSFRRGIGNGLLLSDDFNNQEADPGGGGGGWIGWLAIPPLEQPIKVFLPMKFVSFVFVISHSLALALLSTSV